MTRNGRSLPAFELERVYMNDNGELLAFKAFSPTPSRSLEDLTAESINIYYLDIKCFEAEISASGGGERVSDNISLRQSFILSISKLLTLHKSATTLPVDMEPDRLTACSAFQLI